MRQCMAEDGRMGEGWRKHGMMRHVGMMGQVAMRLSSYLKAMDADKDGTRGPPHPKFTLGKIVGMY
jgi:hypothetical protein